MVQHDEVNFTAATAEVAGDRTQAARDQVPVRLLLRVPA
jgi:hypothetical protein